MQRHELMDLLGQLKLAGMRAHFDEVVTTGRKRQRAFEVILGELLRAEITEKQARSIRYQLGIAKLPLAKETDRVCLRGLAGQSRARRGAGDRRPTALPGLAWPGLAWLCMTPPAYS